MTTQPLFEDTFLRAQWSTEFDASETAFIQRFFVETWGYHLQGGDTPAYTCRPQFEVARAGQTGGTGQADLALGNFGSDGDGVPQVLCEFKDIRSGLDAKQARKGNTRSPVEQCFDYLHSAWQSRDRDTLIEPFFALVTDMNEFRLYARRHGRGQFQRFVISGPASATEPTLLGDTPAAAFRRFIFWKIFQPAMLLADRGTPQLDRLWSDQIVREKAIERDFYNEYRDYREFVYHTLVAANPGFTGSRGQLVRLTSWSPVVRDRAAIAISRRENPPIDRLLAMLDSPNLEERYGVCQTLALLRNRAESATDALIACLSHPDMWLRVKAAEALVGIGQPAAKAVPKLLELMPHEDQANDPRNMHQRYITIALFARGQHLLAESLPTIDRDLLHKTMRAALQN